VLKAVLAFPFRLSYVRSHLHGISPLKGIYYDEKEKEYVHPPTPLAISTTRLSGFVAKGTASSIPRKSIWQNTFTVLSDGVTRATVRVRLTLNAADSRCREQFPY